MIRRRFYNIHMCCWCFDFFFFFSSFSSFLRQILLFYIYFLFCSIIIQKFEWGYTIKYPIKFCIFFFIYNLMRDLCMRTKKQRFYILKYTHTIESFFYTCYTFNVFFISFFIIIICGNWGNCFYNFNESEQKRAPPVREIKSLLRKQVRE